MHALAGDYRSARTCAAAGHRFGWKDADLIAVRKQSLAMSGWVAALRGRLTLGLRLFKLARELDGGSPLQGVSPARYAEILFQMGQVSEGRKIAAELTASTSPIPMRSMAHRILAVLDNRLTEGERQKHFDEAVRLARMMSRREVLIEALVWRGCWSASAGSQEMARADLEQALSYSIGGGYRMFEGLARLGLAALQKRKGMTDAAAQETAAAENVLMAAGYGGPRPV
jgi:hypothetical protein